MLLPIVLDARVVVALGALEIGAEEQPADIAGDDVRLAFAIEEELDAMACLRIAAVGGEYFASDDVPRLVGRERGAQEFVPAGMGNVTVLPALHEHDVEHHRQMPGMFRTGEQALDQRGAFAGRVVREEGADRGRGRDAAGEVEVDSADEFAIGGRAGGVTREVLLRGDQPVNALMQRHRRADGRGSRRGEKEQHGHERDETV